MKTEQHHFVLKEDGKIYHVTMPEKPWTTDTPFKGFPKWAPSHAEIDAYEDAVQSAIANAVEVSNFKEVIDAVFKSDALPKDEHGRKEWKTGAVYSLQCSVKTVLLNPTPNGAEIKFEGKVALVSFQPPVEEGEKEEQDNFCQTFDIIERQSFSSSVKEVSKDGESEAIQNLLATLHRDGGHYTVKHGLLKSIKDAQELLHKEWVLPENLSEVSKEGEKETQEELWDEAKSIVASAIGTFETDLTRGIVKQAIKALRNRYTITRKP